MIPVLKKLYTDSIVPELIKTRGYKNRHQVPVLQKIVINSGVNSSLDKNAAEETAAQIAAITGQKPVITKSKKSIANFKLREGLPIGVKVTLRGPIMYHFFYKLVSIALPAIRDFRGVPVKMDGHGNYTLGITDHTIFPEVTIDSIKRTMGMDITFVTSAKTDEECTELLKMLGMPFRKREKI
jgi:large subunit ribosomal protein L5